MDKSKSKLHGQVQVASINLSLSCVDNCLQDQVASTNPSRVDESKLKSRGQIQVQDAWRNLGLSRVEKSKSKLRG